jgi:hypothetical protein
MKGTIMSDHKTIIYHCLACGSLERAEPLAERPMCCGREMEKAATEAVREEKESHERDGGHCETGPPLPRVRKPPR